MEPDQYRRMVRHIKTAHPNMGKEQWAEIQKRLPPFEIMEDPKTGQKLRIQRFNWPADGDVSKLTVTALAKGFYASIEPDHIQYQHYSIAKQVGGPLIVFENPGYGESDPLTPAQKQALGKEGDFGPVAEAMLGIAGTLGISRINAVGYSMGAAVAEAIAAHAADHGIAVENLLDMENPLVMAAKSIMLAYKLKMDTQNLKFAWAAPLDPVMQEVAKLKYAVSPAMLNYGQAVGRGGSEAVLKKALDTQPDMRLVLVSAGLSTISPPAANREVYKDLKQAYPVRNIRRLVMPGESHAYNNVADRFARLVGLLLSHS
jgi:pimeloyl-ACP methyl ester carboxylesterase